MLSCLIQAATAGTSDGGPSFWAIVGPAIALIAIGVSIVLWWRGRERRSLAYSVAVTQLVRDEARGRIGIAYEGNAVNDPHLIEITIWNSGNAPLRHDDFETSLQVALDVKTRVLSVDIAAVEPEDLSPQIAINDHAPAVEPLLLNPGDGFSAQVLVSDPPGDVQLTGRIAGVRQFESSFNTAKDRLVATTVKLSLPFIGVVLEREAPNRQ